MGERPNERQARELAPLAKADPEEAAKVWRREKERAAGRGVELTAKDLQKAARAVTKRKEKEQKKTKRAAGAGQETERAKLDDRIRLVHADFRDMELPDGTVDAIVTDPPYSAEFLPLFGDLGRFAAGALKDGGLMAVMVGQSYLREILESLEEHLAYHWTFAYLTPGGQSAQLWTKNVNTFWEPVLVFCKGEYDGPWMGDVASSAVNDNDKKHHRWGQSERGMADVLRRVSQEGDLVCDPFVGGGTTAVVARLLGRAFVGCDSDEGCVRTTRGRLML